MSANDADDLDPIETQEWTEALAALRQHRGAERANFVVNAVVDLAVSNSDGNVVKLKRSMEPFAVGQKTTKARVNPNYLPDLRKGYSRGSCATPLDISNARLRRSGT